MTTQLFRLNGTSVRDPAIEAWLRAQAGELGRFAGEWFAVMRGCGDEVREVLHDGCPVACLGDAPFGYVHVFRSHMNVGFFRGSELPDPGRLLLGAGKLMRHVKVRVGVEVDAEALHQLIGSAYRNIKEQVENG